MLPGCVQQVKEAIGTHYVTGGADPEKCDCDEVFAIVFSREKDIGQKWKRCAEQPKTGDEIFSDYLCNILKTAEMNGPSKKPGTWKYSYTAEKDM